MPFPAHYGSVIYVSQRPAQPFVSSPFAGLAVGQTVHFPQEHYEKLQRLFLHKAICWSYEEEVRVLKCLKHTLGDSVPPTSDGPNEIEVGGRPMFLFGVPKKAIKEVYFGYRAPANDAVDLFTVQSRTYPHIKWFSCRIDNSALALATEEFEPLSEFLGG